MKFSLRLQFFLAILIVVGAVVGFVSFLFYDDAVQEIEDQLGQRAKSISVTSALAIDPRDFAALLDDPASLSTLPEYKKIQDLLATIQKDNKLETDIYTLAEASWLQEQMFFVVSGNPEPFEFRGTPVSPRIKTVLSGEATRTGRIKTVDGHWITGSAPIQSDDGAVIGVVEVALNVEGEILAARQAFRRSIAVSGILSLGFAGLMAFVFSAFLTARIRRLMTVFQRYGAGDHQVRVHQKGSDEVSKLGASFNELADSLNKSRQEIVRRNEALKIALDKAEAANHAKSEFLANMSHEIRTPLNAVIGMASVISTTDLNDKQKSYVSRIESSGQALAGLINDILDFSKIEAQELQLNEEVADVVDVCEHVVELFLDRALEKSIDLHCYIDANLPKSFLCDAHRLRQVVVNLMGNAMKFTDLGSVTLSVRHLLEDGEPWALFEVLDTGIGVDDVTKNRLFQPFIQADSSTTKKYGGTGLGLSISKNLVELMGGEIGVVDNHPQGSNFWFKIPVREGQCVLTESRTQLLGKCVLVVDRSDALYLRATLESWGLEVATRSSISQLKKEIGLACAVEANTDDVVAAGRPPDLVVVSIEDYLLNSIDGDIFAQTFGRVCPVIAVKPMDFDMMGVGSSVAMPSDIESLETLDRPIRLSILREKILKNLAGAKMESHDSHPGSETVNHVGQRILVVEDNVANRELMDAMCTSIGIDVDFAVNGEEGFEKALGEQYDLVFMDWQMPVMDGVTSTKKIRETISSEQLPIVAMTGNALIGDREKCLAAGMNDYMAKPVTISAVRQMLEKWLQPQASGSPKSEVREEVARDGDTLEGGIQKDDKGSMNDRADIVTAQERAELAKDEGVSTVAKPLENLEVVQDKVAVDPKGNESSNGDNVVHIDDSALDMLRTLPSKDGGTLLGQMIHKFVETAPTDVKAIADAIDSGIKADVKAKAHKFKSSCGIVGAKYLASICRDLEYCEPEASAELFAQLQREYDLVAEILSTKAA